jgi:hypothetical protein
LLKTSPRPSPFSVKRFQGKMSDYGAGGMNKCPRAKDPTTSSP